MVSSLPLAFVAAALLAPPPPAATAAPAAPATHLVRLVPRTDTKSPKGRSDPGFWAIVKLGRDAVPELLAQLDDDMRFEPVTGVPELGGVYARGDIALEALLEIIDVPWQELVPRNVKNKRVPVLGFGAYYEYVRAAPANRKQLADAVRKWVHANEGRLVRMELPDHPAGGYWAVPE